MTEQEQLVCGCRLSGGFSADLSPADPKCPRCKGTGIITKWPPDTYTAILAMQFPDGTYLCLEPDGVWRRYTDFPTKSPGCFEMRADEASKLFTEQFDMSDAGTSSYIFFHGDVSKGKIVVSKLAWGPPTEEVKP